MTPRRSEAPTAGCGQPGDLFVIPGWPRAAGTGAALLWALLCVRWFDPGASLRPAWLVAVPPGVLGVPALVLGILWLRGRWSVLRGRCPEAPGLLLAVGLAIVFRFPMAWQGAAGYTTSDGALSGIVALHVRAGASHPVFVPNVPYSGSLKSHLTVPLSVVADMPRAFALASVLFYALFVAALCRLAASVVESAALPAGLYAVFAPVFVTHYSLSNDGNYVEVLALGTWALVLAAAWAREEDGRPERALAIGLLLGLAFWCHILAVIHVAAVGLALLLADWRRTLRSAPAVSFGFALGYLPGLLWNAENHWDSFRYLLPGGPSVGRLDLGPGLVARVAATVADHSPVLMGYDVGYPALIDALLRGLAWTGVGAAVYATIVAARAATDDRSCVLRVLLLFAGVNLAVAVAALPYIPGNPRYLLFLMAPLPVFLAMALDRGLRRGLLVLLVATGALGSLGQFVGESGADARWRAFVSDLEREGVGFCYSDFYLATKINFLSEERVVCSSELGPTTTEYFREYRDTLRSAHQAAFVAVNQTSADKLERRLERLAIGHERRNLMKPVLLRLSRKVEPGELLAAREEALGY